MEVFLTPHFKRESKRVVRSFRKEVESAVALFLHDPFDSRLHTHKLTGKLQGFWSFSVTYRLRILFEFEGKERAVFHSIGDHNVYD
jgi:mRNA-degrading endonuclease YafQ of YafQ-DinJ toxin-antitoxin module